MLLSPTGTFAPALLLEDEVTFESSLHSTAETTAAIELLQPCD